MKYPYLLLDADNTLFDFDAGNRHAFHEVCARYDIPDTEESFRATLDQVLALAPENITVHTLSMKKGARLKDEGGDVPGGETVGAMLDDASPLLRERG